MAKHRSKKDRVRAEKHRATQSKQATKTKFLVEKTNDIRVISKPKAASFEKLFTYDPRLIIKDLRKTFLLVMFILLVLLSISLLYT